MAHTATVVLSVVAIVLFLAVVALLVLYFLKPSSKQVLGNQSSEIRDYIRDGLNIAIQTAAKFDVPIPDLYAGCSGSTINRIRFCGNLKMSDSYNVGGNEVCQIPYQACRAGCAIGCTACKIIPFISCGGPCKDCPNGCQTVYDKCSGALRVGWSVNILEVRNIGNTMRIDDLESFVLSYDEKTHSYTLTMRIPVLTQPLANVDIRVTTGISNYQGDIRLGNLRIVVPMTLYYDCRTKQAGIKNIGKLEVSGIDLEFASISGLTTELLKSIVKLVKNNLENSVRDIMESKLTDFFNSFLQSQVPKLNLDINCPRLIV